MVTNGYNKPAAELWRSAAIDALNKNNYKRAAECYFKAAEEYKINYQNASDPLSKKNYENEFNFCLKKGLECKNPRIEVVKPRRGIPVSKGGNLENIVDEDAIVIEKRTPKYNFDDVGGMNELKQTFETKIIETLVSPSIYDMAKSSSKQSYLLYGPPGCGKTYIFEAMVGELNKQMRKQGKKEAVFIRADVSDIKNKYVGNSEKNLKAYFEEAAKCGPCVLFFDELDALGGKRSGESKHADELVNAFLQFFDIIKDKPVIVVGATNRPEELDSALLRTGRFGDNIILVPMPDYDARKELFKIHSKKMKDIGILSKDVNFDELAKVSYGYASSDIKTMCDPDALDIAKCRDKKMGNAQSPVSQTDFLEAIKGKKSSLLQWKDERKHGMIDMSIYKNRKVIELRAGVPDKYMDLVELLFELEGKQVVYENGLYKVKPLPELPVVDAFDGSNGGEELAA